MADYDRSATGPLPVDAGPRRAESIFDLSPEDFRASLGEMQAMGHDTDALMRQYRARNSPFAPINNAAEAQAQGLADSGRSSVLGGLLSKPEGATGMDAIMGLEREGWRGLLGTGQQVGQAIDAPAAAYQGLIPDQDVNMEALNTAGMAMGAGGAATAPSGALRSGLAREAGLSEAQRQARDILDMRAAGNARSVTDDMMARADDQYMFDNTPLPMDEASRLARADMAGRNERAYHGTGSDINAASPDMGRGARTGTGFFSSKSPATSETYAPYTGGAVYPLMRRGDSQIVSADNQSWNNIESPVYAYDPVNFGDTELIDEFGRASTDDIARAARQSGMESISIQDVSDRGPRAYGTTDYPDYGTVNVDFNPQNIRSRFARFDPEFSHLSNLSAANASPTAGLLASGAQEQDKPLPFMEMLRGLLR
jgi:hypothetical protein